LLDIEEIGEKSVKFSCFLTFFPVWNFTIFSVKKSKQTNFVKDCVHSQQNLRRRLRPKRVRLGWRMLEYQPKGQTKEAEAGHLWHSLPTASKTSPPRLENAGKKRPEILQ
jgi:hypothetical protein